MSKHLVVTIDFESRSHANLLEVGEWNYSLDPTTDILCLCYTIGDGDVQEWWPGMVLRDEQAWEDQDKNEDGISMPKDLYMAIMQGALVEAFKVYFEYSMWKNICVDLWGWVEILDHQWRDLQATAAYYSLPQGLDKLASALGLPGKDPRGKQLITKYCKLFLKTAKKEIPEDDWNAMLDYCAEDVACERDISCELPELPPEEIDIFKRCLKINARGIPINKSSVEDAIVIFEEKSEELRKEFRKLTGINPSQHKEVMKWLKNKGYVFANLQGDYIDRVLKGKEIREKVKDANEEHELDDIKDPIVRKALEIRREHSRASTKKLKPMLRYRDPKGRARFQTVYHGASTGRETGSGFQPLNMNKGYEHVPAEQLLADMRHRSPKWLEIQYGDAIEAVGKATRHHIKAEEGNRFIVADFTSFEAVILACEAGEQWKIDAFRNGDPVYELMACKIHGLGPEAVAFAKRDKNAFKAKYPKERFDGKTGELAGGYQGWIGAWRKFDNSDRYTDEEVGKILKMWREENPEIVNFWSGMNDACMYCVGTGKPSQFRNYKFVPEPPWMAMELPNGNRIWYYYPDIRNYMPFWHDPENDEDCMTGNCSCTPRAQVTYMTYKGGHWHRTSTYGGKLTENAIQATQREALEVAKRRLDKAGYNIILTIYDEIIAEMPEGEGDVEEFEYVMSKSPGEWGDEWPISVEGWEGKIYKKAA